MNLDATVIIAVALPLMAGIGALYIVRSRPRWKRPIAWMGAGVVVFFALKFILVLLLSIAAA